jgi:hypothetical protein
MGVIREGMADTLQSANKYTKILRQGPSYANMI